MQEHDTRFRSLIEGFFFFFYCWLPYNLYGELWKFKIVRTPHLRYAKVIWTFVTFYFFPLKSNADICNIQKWKRKQFSYFGHVFWLASFQIIKFFKMSS
jgi:uncharacterized membrane protein YagU involved in acid resistance